jgi:hypothetical protein
MDGLCIDTAKLRKLMAEQPTIPIETSQALYATMMARYIEKAAADQVISAVTTALGTDGIDPDKNVIDQVTEAGTASQEATIAKIEEVSGTVTGAITTAKEAIAVDITTAKNAITGDTTAAKDGILAEIAKIPTTCPTPGSRRLATPEEKIEEILSSSSDPVRSPEDKVRDFLRSDAAKKTMDEASHMGLESDQVEDVISQLLGLSGGDEAKAANEKLKASIEDPEVLGYLESLLSAEITNNSGTHAEELAGRILKTAVNPKTRQLDVEKLHGIQTSLRSLREDHKTRARKLGLQSSCEDALKAVVTVVKDFIKDTLDMVITALAEGLEGANAFSSVLGNDSGYDTDDVAKALQMPLGMVQVMDPWRQDGFLAEVMGGVIKVSQRHRIMSKIAQTPFY